MWFLKTKVQAWYQGTGYGREVCEPGWTIILGNMLKLSATNRDPLSSCFIFHFFTKTNWLFRKRHCIVWNLWFHLFLLHYIYSYILGVSYFIPYIQFFWDFFLKSHINCWSFKYSQWESLLFLKRIFWWIITAIITLILPFLLHIVHL